MENQIPDQYAVLLASLGPGTGLAPGWKMPPGRLQPDLNEEEAEAIVRLKAALEQGNRKNLADLTDRMIARAENLSLRTRFWTAYALGELGRTGDCLAQMSLLLNESRLDQRLAPGQLVWLATGYPDQHVLAGRHQEARRLYRQLLAGGRPELILWGRYQLAGLDFLDGAYSAALAGYQAVCEAEIFEPWTEQACSMSKIAALLAQYRREGKPYGAAAYFTP